MNQTRTKIQPRGAARHGNQEPPGQAPIFVARRPIGSCNLVLFVHHWLMRGEKAVHDSRIGAKPFVHCET